MTKVSGWSFVRRVRRRVGRERMPGVVWMEVMMRLFGRTV